VHLAHWGKQGAEGARANRAWLVEMVARVLMSSERAALSAQGDHWGLRAGWAFPGVWATPARQATWVYLEREAVRVRVSGGVGVGCVNVHALVHVSLTRTQALPHYH